MQPGSLTSGRAGRPKGIASSVPAGAPPSPGHTCSVPVSLQCFQLFCFQFCLHMVKLQSVQRGQQGAFTVLPGPTPASTMTSSYVSCERHLGLLGVKCQKQLCDPPRQGLDEGVSRSGVG